MTGRRALLAGGATLLVAGAGCTAFGDPDDDPVLRSIALRNLDDRPHALQLRLARRDDELLDATYDLGARTVGDSDDSADHLAAIEDAWDDGTGAFTAKARLDGNDRRAEMRLDDGVSAGPYRYEIRIDGDGGIEGWYAELSETTT